MQEVDLYSLLDCAINASIKAGDEIMKIYDSNFEFTTKKEHIKKPKRKTWYPGLVVLWIFTDYPIHDIGEKYLFSVHSVEHLVLALVSPPLLLMGMHKDMKKLISIKPFIRVLKITSKPVVAFFMFNFVMVGMHWHP